MNEQGLVMTMTLKIPMNLLGLMMMMLKIPTNLHSVWSQLDASALYKNYKRNDNGSSARIVDYWLLGGDGDSLVLSDQYPQDRIEAVSKSQLPR